MRRRPSAARASACPDSVGTLGASESLEDWASALSPHKILADCIFKALSTKNGQNESSATGILAQLNTLTVDDIERICSDLHYKVKKRFARAVMALEESRRAQDLVMVSGWRSSPSHDGTESSSNSKFHMEDFVPQVASFGGVDAYHSGLDRVLGLPSHKVFETMKDEHTKAADSDQFFITTNHGGIYTTPAREWQFALSPKHHSHYPGLERTPEPLISFLDKEEAKKAGLTFEETLALRLYTGPMFMKYNAVLRKSPEDVLEQLKGNHYSTTIQAAVSGIVKLSKIWKCPPNRKVYRGLAGLKLPDAFFKADGDGFCGGVEMGIMSTTTRRGLATNFSLARDGSQAVLLEIDVGQVDRGASLRWVSQFPEEDEVVIAPLSNLEIVGRARVEMEPGWEGPVLIFPMRLNVNNKHSTLDELLSRRKVLHVEMMKTLYDQICKQIPSKAATLADRAQLLAEFMHLSRATEAKPPSWFNDDHQYRQAINEVLNLKVGIEKKWKLLTNKCSYSGDHLLLSKIMHASCHDFSDEGFIYVLRSGTGEIPWSAIMQGLDYISIPERLGLDQYMVMWECIQEHSASMKAIKIDNQEGNPLEIPVQDILQPSHCRLNGYQLGPKIAAVLPGLMMNRGLTSLDLSGNKLGVEGSTSLCPALVAMTGLQTLHLKANCLGSNAMKHITASLVRTSSLTCLTLSLNPLGDEGLVSLSSALRHHTNMQTLDLSWTLFGDKGLSAIADTLKSLGSLTSFEIHGETGCLSPQGLEKLAEAYRANPKLRHTLFHLPRPEQSQTPVLSALATLENLDILQLAGSCRSFEDTQQVAKVLGSNKNLRIMANGWEMVGCQAMRMMKEAQEENPMLEKLMLFECRVEPGAFKELTELIRHPMCRLTHLDIFGLHKDGEQLGELWRDLSLPSTLETLRIVASGLGCVETKGLCHACENCGNLTNLNLSKNRIGSEGITELAGVIPTFSLTALDLSDNKTGGEMALQLAAALPQCDKLADLDLSNNEITLTGALQLRHFLRMSRSMTNLNLSNNRLHMHDKEESSPFESFDGLLTLCQVCERLKHVDLERNGLSPKLTEMFMKFVHTLNAEKTRDLESAGPKGGQSRNPMYWIHNPSAAQPCD